MKVMKKFVSVLLSLLMVFSLFTVVPFTAKAPSVIRKLRTKTLKPIDCFK